MDLEALMRVFPQVFGQRDPQWGAAQLGAVRGASIHDVGCYLCAMAMTAARYGYPIRPDALNVIYTTRGLYVDGNLMTDNQLAHVYADITFMASHDYADRPADLHLLQQLSADDTLTTILRVDFSAAPGVQDHFVCLQGYDSHRLLIADPWYNDWPGQYGSVADFATHYGTDLAGRILKYVVYRGTPSPIPLWMAPFSATPQRAALGFYAGPSTAQHLYDTMAKPGTALPFESWTLGEPILDTSMGTYDRRWYWRHNPQGQSGWTASAWVTGNAPGSHP